MRIATRSKPSVSMDRGLQRSHVLEPGYRQQIIFEIRILDPCVGTDLLCLPSTTSILIAPSELAT